MAAAKPVSAGVVHEIPGDLSEAILADAAVVALWEGSTPLARNEWICWVEDAKKAGNTTQPDRTGVLGTQGGNATSLLLDRVCAPGKAKLMYAVCTPQRVSRPSGADYIGIVSAHPVLRLGGRNVRCSERQGLPSALPHSIRRSKGPCSSRLI